MSKHEIVLSNWKLTCADGCCDSYGCEVYVNGESITRYYGDSASSLQLVLDALGINAEVKEEWDDYDRDSYNPEDQYDEDEEF